MKKLVHAVDVSCAKERGSAHVIFETEGTVMDGTERQFHPDGYDVIILGTGPAEIVVSLLLSTEGKRVLHLDRNPHYGNDLPSLSLRAFYDRIGKGEVPAAASRDSSAYNIDLMPKFFMPEDALLDLIKRLGMTGNLEFEPIRSLEVMIGSRFRAVPFDSVEAARLSGDGLFGGINFEKFFDFFLGLNMEDQSTWQGVDLDTQSVSDVFERFKLGDVSRQLIAHGLARYSDNDYKSHPARELFLRITPTVRSAVSTGSSPYIFPKFGLGELSLCAVRFAAAHDSLWGIGVSIESVQMGGSMRKFSGLVVDGRFVKATHLVGDPSYFPGRVTTSRQVIRAVCVLDQPISKTDRGQSQLVIIPGVQVDRNNDIYMTCVSDEHAVSPRGKFVVTVSTWVEGINAEAEIAPALEVLGSVDRSDYVVHVSDMLEPLTSAVPENIFISRSCDATPYFDGVYEDVRRIYLGVTGRDLDLKQWPTSSFDGAS